MSMTIPYTPLAAHEIRLLKASKADGLLAIELKKTTFDDAPNYITISYCWEGQTPNYPITCNGQKFSVTENVAVILHYIAKFHPSRHIWIDAVCINQADVPEKNVHVKQMGQIYERASSTVAWIGREDEDISAMLLDLPNMLQEAREFIDNSAIKVRRPGFPVNRPFAWLGLYKLMLKPWFRRLWIIQEIVLSKTVSFVCGESVVDAGSLLPLVNEYVQYTTPTIIEVNIPSSDFWKGLVCFQQVCTLRKQRQAGTFRPHGLPELIPTTQDFLVFDPRDRVYGLLGITSSYWRDLVSVSYQIPTENLYIEFANLWLAKRPYLLALNQASSHSPMPGLPSWCPNFHQTQIPYQLGKCYRTVGYSAGTSQGKNDWANWQQPQPEDNNYDNVRISVASTPEIHSDKLPITGFVIGHAESVVPAGWLISHDNHPDNAMVAASLKWEKECLKISQSVYHQLNSIPIAHARTLIANKLATYPSQQRYTGNVLRAYEMSIERLSNQHSWDEDVPELMLTYIQSLQITCFGRAFFSTSSGTIGVGPGETKVGDMICIFNGGVTPFVIRPKNEDPDLYEFLGEAYVDGIMYGEALEMEEAKNTTTFTLV